MKKLIMSIVGGTVLLLGNLIFAAEKSETRPPDQPERVSARVGIEIQDGAAKRSAKAYEDVKAGDKFRIYALPESGEQYLYVVYADQENVEQLNDPEKEAVIAKDNLLLLPSCQEDELYKFDEKSARVAITLIGSAVRLPELETLFKTAENLPAKWAELEQNLMAQNKIELSTPPLKPYFLAGSTRGICNGKGDAAFLEKLKVSSGKAMVVKKYEFRIQK